MGIGQRYLRCKRCHRKLKTEEAQKRGYGHYCFQQHLAEVNSKKVDLITIAKELEQNKNTKN